MNVLIHGSGRIVGDLETIRVPTLTCSRLTVDIVYSRPLIFMLDWQATPK